MTLNNAYLTEKSSKIKRDEIIEWFGSKANFITHHQQHITLPDTSLFIDV